LVSIPRRLAEPYRGVRLREITLRYALRPLRMISLLETPNSAWTRLAGLIDNIPTSMEVQAMPQAALIKKLRIQAGERLLILNAPPGYIESLGDLPEGARVSEVPEGEYQFVHLFVTNSEDLGRLRQAAMDAVEYDGLLWISYPKRSSKVATDLTRDVLWELMGDTGLRPVTQVSVDEVWSALRFRPAEMVGN